MLAPALRVRAVPGPAAPLPPPTRLESRTRRPRVGSASRFPGGHDLIAVLEGPCPDGVDGRRQGATQTATLAVPVCGDDETALVRVRELMRDVGCEPVAAGGLERAGLLEATAALFIALWGAEGADAQAIAPPLAYATRPGHRDEAGGEAAHR